MKPSLLARLDELTHRFEELGRLLGEPEVIADQNRFRQLSREFSDLEAVVESYRDFCSSQQALQETRIMLEDESHPEMRALVEEEVREIEERLARQKEQLQQLLLPRDPDDTCDVFLEIRAGTGGQEAALFAGDLFRMYSRYAERCRWKLEVVSASAGEQGGYREIISRVLGTEVYAHLKFESGAHRVQRIPATESQGRIHTSACTVAVLPDPGEQAGVELAKDQLRIDTFRASGAGGQHVNTTDSAVRITHLPSGMVVECQDERSQHKNKARALTLLAARLQAAQQEAQSRALSETRKSLVGSGDRSERIRTYNYPQGRVTDHRINLTLYQLPAILEGELNPLIEPLLTEHKAEQLAALSQEPESSPDRPA